MKDKLSYLFDITFWRYAGARALHTIAQVILGTISATAIRFNDVDWLLVLQTSVIATILSLAKSIVFGMPETKKDIIVDNDKYE